MALRVNSEQIRDLLMSLATVATGNSSEQRALYVVCDLTGTPEHPHMRAMTVYDAEDMSPLGALYGPDHDVWLREVLEGIIGKTEPTRLEKEALDRALENHTGAVVFHTRLSDDGHRLLIDYIYSALPNGA